MVKEKNQIIIIMYIILKLLYLTALVTGLTLGVVYSIKPLWITCLVFLCLYSCSISLERIKEEKGY